MSSKIALGIHESGTVTNIALIDDQLRILAQRKAGPLNFEVMADAQEQLKQQLLATLQDADLDAEQVNIVYVAVAQHLNRSVNEPVAAMFPRVPPGEMKSEGVPALIAGAGGKYGVIAVCNEGSVSYGFKRGQGVQVGGRGNYLAQSGSYAIGQEVWQAIYDAFDGLGGLTVLTERILLRFGVRSLGELEVLLDDSEDRSGTIASLTNDAIELEKTDAIATGIISRIADKLAVQVQAVVRRLGMNGKQFPVIMAGDLFSRSALLQTLFVARVQASVPGAVPSLLTQDFAVCAALTALYKVGVALPKPDLSEKMPPRRATEQRNPLTVDIQNRPTSDFVRLMNAEDQRVPRLIEPELDHIATLIDAVAERYEKGGRLFFVGAGTSGRLAVLDAAECRPTFGTTLDEVAGILAGGEAAMIHSIEGAEDDEAQGRAEIAARDVGSLDTVIGVAASGSTPFVVSAVREAQDRGALTGCIVNNAESVIAPLVQHPIVVPTGPEVIMGSTRLKAGTAQKLVLNMISTGVMMRVGKTYGNLMTDMQMSNIKLRKRAAVVVAEATELPIEEATDLLERCNHEMKTAIASYLLNLSPGEARSRLETYKGNLYRCIQASSAK